MKQLFNGSAMNLIPFNHNVVYLTRPEQVPYDVMERTGDGKTVIAYRQYSPTEGDAMITKSVYMMAKFGADFDFYLNNLPDYLNCKAVALGQYMLIVNHKGEATMYTREGGVKWSGSLKYKGFEPADVIADDGFVWCSYPESNAIIKYNVQSMQQVFRVGGGTGGDLDEPFGLWAADGKLIITSNKTGKIMALDLDTFYLEKLWDLDEPAQQYLKVDSHEIVLCESGIYEL